MKGNYHLKTNLSNSLVGNRDEDDSLFSFFLSIVMILMVSLLSFMLFFGLCTIKMNSMNDTFFSGDHILIYKYPLSLKNGNVVILKENRDESVRPVHEALIKRIIAKEDDTIRFEKDKHIILNQYTVKLFIKQKGEREFKVLDEPYIKDGRMTCLDNEPTDAFYELLDKDILVPKNHFFLMGDNRDFSLDSRKLGFFHKSEILGKYCIGLKAGGFWERVFLFLYGDAME